MQNVHTNRLLPTAPVKTKKRPVPWAPVLMGTCVVDHSTKQLLNRIQAGQIAVLSHQDLDETAALELIEKKVTAILNAQPTFSGAFETTGARRLLEAGIPVFDLCHPQDIQQFSDGMMLWLTDKMAGSWLEEEPCPIASIQRLTWDLLNRRWKAAKARRLEKFVQFTENTWKHALKDLEHLAKPMVHLPLRTAITGRDAVIVVRGPHFKRDLLALHPYIERENPVLIAVDGGANALLEMDLPPDIIIGDMDSVSTEALMCGAELVVHAYPDGTAPGERRIRSLGLTAYHYPMFGTSEDAALMLAYEEGAKQLIVVGSHTGMIDFFEKGRLGMGSTWLIRMWVGERLIDAKGFHRLTKAFYGGEPEW